jgi:hypothetical protein
MNIHLSRLIRISKNLPGFELEQLTIKAVILSLTVMVPVFAYGPGAEIFRGIYENNEVFHKIMKNWLIVQ